LIQYYKLPLSKRIDHSKLLYLNTIIMDLASFYIFASTTTLADTQNATDSTEINKLLEVDKTLYNQQEYDEAIQNYDKALQIDPNYTDALNSKGNVLKELCRQ